MVIKKTIKPAAIVVAHLPKLVVEETPENEIDCRNLVEAQGKITVIGTGNKISFGPGAKLKGNIDIRGDNNIVIFGAGTAMRGRVLVKGKNQRVSVGDHTTFQSAYLLCQEGCEILIGRWCMFSREIEIRTTDAHSVIDLSTNMRINTPASVVIGDHVWVSVGVLISKGAQLANDTIVGAKAFVNGKFTEENTIIGGAPARIVKRGVSWHRSRKPKFSLDEINEWRLTDITDEDGAGDEE